MSARLKRPYTDVKSSSRTNEATVLLGMAAAVGETVLAPAQVTANVKAKALRLAVVGVQFDASERPLVVFQ